MIVRVLNGGQYELGDEARARLEKLDSDLSHAASANDEQWFHRALAAVIAEVTEGGTPLDSDRLVPSDLVVPAPDATLDEVRELVESDSNEE
ncbi:MAG: hypothetical protein M0014_02510 [Actinomycetota bacterium]|nr:hypothetical protein [Actinomycetota bacterium]